VNSIGGILTCTIPAFLIFHALHTSCGFAFTFLCTTILYFSHYSLIRKKNKERSANFSFLGSFSVFLFLNASLPTLKALRLKENTDRRKRRGPTHIRRWSRAQPAQGTPHHLTTPIRLEIREAARFYVFTCQLAVFLDFIFGPFHDWLGLPRL